MMLFLVSQYFFLRSPLFEFQEVEVAGASSVSAQLIEKKLGLAKKTSYWQISPESLQTNLSSLHRLKEAEVNVTFPGRVEVAIAEREPSFFASFVANGNQWFTVDGEGVVLDRAAPQTSRLRVVLSHPLRDGARLRTSDLEVVKFFQDNLNESMRVAVRAIKIGQNEEVSLKVDYRNNPLWVRLGRAEKLQYKLFLLEQLLTKLGKDKEEILAIDLRYSAPVVSKKVVKPVSEPVAVE